jgi:hypothetical protein
MSSTATIKSFPLPPAFTAADLYSIDEDGSADATSNEHVSRMGRTTRAPSQPSAHPAHPGMQNASRFQDRSQESFHTTLKRPKKLAGISANNSSGGGGSSGSGSNYTPPPSPLAHEGIDGPRKRTPSIGNRMNLNTLETSSWVRESVYQSSPIRTAFRPDRGPNELFNLLPGEVLDLVLQSLKALHLGKNSESCATCLMRDLCSTALCSRRWYKHARVAL